MSLPSFDPAARYRKAQGQALLFGHAMIVLMMVTVAAAFGLFGTRLFREWSAWVPVILSLILSIEAIFTREQTREMDTREKVTFHLSEWVAFAVIAKVILYLVRGFDSLLADIPRWQADFLANFFTADYLYLLLVMTVVWFLSRAYTGGFEALYDRENDALWEDLGKLQNALHDIRRRIGARLFIVGILVVALAVLTRADFPGVFQPLPVGWLFSAPVVIIVVYFLTTLVLLSHTQFSLLRTRWLWQRLPISPGLAANWLRYGLIAFALLAVIVLMLPTRYSIGLLDTLRILLDFGMRAFSAVFFVLTLPVTLCLSIISLFSGEESAPQSQQPIMPPGVPPAGPAGEPVAWLEFLKSLLFWAIFIAVVFFALRYYFGQNTALWNAIKNFPLFRLVGSVLKGFWSWVRGANRQIAGFVGDTIKRLRIPRAAAAPQALRRIFNLGRMTPREKVIHFYLSLVRLGGERGLDRRPSQTPYAYEQQLRSAVPEIDPDLHSLTDTFLEARYSEHAVGPDRSDQAATLWERIKAALQRWRSES